MSGRTNPPTLEALGTKGGCRLEVGEEVWSSHSPLGWRRLGKEAPENMGAGDGLIMEMFALPRWFPTTLGS